jgi:sulfatase maturation enzyme AslB (radical SAM superfamily)
LVLGIARASREYDLLVPNAAIVLFTNGLLLTPRRLEVLERESIQLLISFDGYGERSALRYGEHFPTMSAHMEAVISSAIKASIPTTVVFTVGRHNVDFLLSDMSRLHDQHGVSSFSVVIIRRNDFAARCLAERRDAVVQWARDNDIDMDWKPIGQRGSQHDSYFFSACHTRHLHPRELGTWDKSGW